ncbi:hypothetical protein D9757_011142 [Collybiopsis confluens]|uniref:Polyketide synthase n=1 Tax=Collybiopsis confluens TaxID=2823264 RepID=A0A8H5H828_9AGAR|nr:hypothetical protein D9757_011142 [Collybiopsis confluens]
MSKTPIAIIGIATELPSGCHSSVNLGHKQFNDFLNAKKESYETIPAYRLNIAEWHGQGLGKIIASQGSFLKEIELFDPIELGITSKDARAMGVSTRKLIEISFLALLDSGVDFRGKNIGCYASGTAVDMQSVAEPDEFEPQGSVAGLPCMIANKVSYHLDLRGPSIPVDTACSSTLVATHLAVQAIRNGECSVAVVSGCQLNLRASDFALYSQASILSPDGKCKPFDAEGDGFGRAEGAAAIILKPLEQALEDGDYIYGTILGTGISTCGSLGPISAPVAESQKDAMERAYEGIGRRPSDADYVELHGTGTAVGDPTEANWVGQAFARDAELIIGSVKGNIGHTEITSFLASLSKVLSIFETRQVPPQVNLRYRNKAIQWDKFRLRAPLEAETLDPQSKSGRFLISICSSGIGGVNGHAVIESFPASNTQDTPLSFTEEPLLLVAGGLSPRSCTTIGEDIQELLRVSPGRSVDYSIIYGRRVRQMNWRSFALKTADNSSPSFSIPVLTPRVKPSITFLFSGQGPQHFNMGRQLFQRYAAFRHTISSLDSIYNEHTGKSMIRDHGLFDNSPNADTISAVWPISLTITSLAMVQIALFDLMVSLGVRPNILIGHSAGEVALLYASGAGSKEMAFEIAIARGKAMSIVEEQMDGTMAAVSCSSIDAQHIINAVTARAKASENSILEIACYNSPQAVALAGHTKLINDAIVIAKRSGFLARKIMTKVPVHSRAMELCDIIEDYNAEYFWVNTRNPVQFARSMSTLASANPGTVVVEMGPHPVLAGYVQDLGVDPTSLVFPMYRTKIFMPHNEQETLIRALGKLITAGYNGVNFNSLCNRATPHPALKPYPFMKKTVEYWPKLSRVMDRQMSSRNGPLCYPDLRVNSKTHPELAEHIINSEPIMPAAGFIEMGLELGARTLWKVKFHSIFSLSAFTPPLVNITRENSKFLIQSKPVPGAPLFFDHDVNNWKLHAEGYLSELEYYLQTASVSLSGVMMRTKSRSLVEFYGELRRFAQYGPSYTRIDQVFTGNNEALVRIKGLNKLEASNGRYVLHPAILDACFHPCISPMMTKVTDPNIYFLPSKLNSLTLAKEFESSKLITSNLFCYILVEAWEPEQVTYNITLADDSGLPLCYLQGLSVQKHFQVPLMKVRGRFELQYQSYAIEEHKLLPEDLSRHLSNSSDNMAGSHRTRLLNYSRNILHSIMKEKQWTEWEPLSQDIQDIVLKNQGMHPLYFIAAFPSHQKKSRFDSILNQHEIINLTEHSVRSSSLPLPNDLVIGSISREICLSDRKNFQDFKTLLVPGGFLILHLCNIEMPLEAVREVIRVTGFTVITIDPSILGGPGILLAQRNSTSPNLSPLTATVNQVFTYKLGKEIELQQYLRVLHEVHRAGPIWLVALEGQDAHALRGLFRTLVREFPHLNIRSAAFASQYSSQAIQQQIIQQYLPQSGAENEFVVEENMNICVPRIMPMPSSAANIEWGKRMENNSHNGINHVSVECCHFSPDIGLWGVVGMSKNDNARVVGITSLKPHSGNALLQTGWFAELAPELPGDMIARAAPTVILIGLSLGLTVLQDPTRLISRVILTHIDTPTGQMLNVLLGALNTASPITTLVSITPTDLYNIHIQPEDIIFTGLPEHDPLLSSYLSFGTQVIYFTSSSSYLISLKRDPHFAHDILATFGAYWSKTTFSPHIQNETNDATDGFMQSIFNPRKVYMLLGGLGSFGPFAALWMYQRGARHIVLTSRSGRTGMPDRMKDSLTMRVLTYLENKRDLSLAVEAVGGTNKNAMSALISSLKLPLGGILLLATVFNDSLFLHKDPSNFTQSFNSKVGTLKTLEEIVDLTCLDFIVSVSSMTIWGNPGQADYTSANTALDGMLLKYRNAFSIAAPAVNDTSSMIRKTDTVQESHLSFTACSPEELCAWIEDGILCLHDRPIGLYVPPHDFTTLSDTLGSSILYNHLATSHDRRLPTGAPVEDLPSVLAKLVTDILEIPSAEFSNSVPLTSYGLDSIAAGRLSYALKPHISISQMQLLSDITLVNITERAGKAMLGPERNVHPSDKDLSPSPWSNTTKVTDIDNLLSQFSIGLEENAPRMTGPFYSNAVVLITGTTGTLGSYLLAELVRNPDVELVYAFNRPSSGSSVTERQHKTFQSLSLDRGILETNKIIFIEGDASKPDLGLDLIEYRMIQSKTGYCHN